MISTSSPKMVPITEVFGRLQQERKISSGEDLEQLRRMLDHFGQFRAIKRRIEESSLRTSLLWPSVQLEESLWSDIGRHEREKGFDPEWIRKRNGQFGLTGYAYNDGIPCEYEEIILTYDGLERMVFPVPVKRGGKCGLVLADGIGTPVTEFRYDQLFRIPNTEYIKYVAIRDSLYGLVGTDGTEDVPCNYDGIYECPLPGNRLFPIRKGNKWGFYYAPFEFIKPRYDELVFVEDDYIQAQTNGLWGWISYDGRFTVDKSKAYFRHNAE